MKHRPTMRDVASAAGVSLKTVSRVVNDEPGVREQTASRVIAAIERLGFTRNELASGLRHGRAGALGLLIEDVANPFYSEIARAVEDVALSYGHVLLTGSCGEEPARERDLVARFLGRSVDALLLVSAAEDHRYLLPELHGPDGSGTPVVFLDRPPVGIEADAVIADNRGGARTAIRHLLAHGHRRIAVVADALAVWTTRERLAGSREELAAAGVDADPDLIRSGGPDAATAEAIVRELLVLPAERRPTAIFAINNRITLGTLRALADHPEPLALVGFDDFELADMLPTPVTVVRQSAGDMGRLAAQTAYECLANPARLPERRTLPCELVARGSGEVAP